MTKESPGALSQSDRSRILQEFSQIKRESGGTVVFTGGEPFLKKQEMKHLLAQCRELGLASSVITNASLLTEGDCEGLLDLELKHFGVSLDSLSAQTHDWIRGVAGTHELVTRFLRLYTSGLRNRRSQGQSLDSFAHVASILTQETLPHALELVKYATEELGVDGVSFQALSPTFANSTGQDPFFEKHFPSDPAMVNEIFGQLQALVPTGKIYNTPTDLEWMREYFLRRSNLIDPVCDSGNRNVIVNMYGDVQLCFSMKELVTGDFVGNVRRQSLGDILGSDSSGQAREKMANCRYSCGMLNCHVKQE